MRTDTKRTLPGTDLSVSSLGLGCAKIGGAFTGSSRKEERRLLRQALDNGINVFDTADIYAQGGSERLIGEAFRECRGDVVIVSKVGYQLPRRKSVIRHAKPLLKPIAARLGISPRIPPSISGGFSGQCFDSDAIHTAVEGSLRRLQTDHIDLLLVHCPSADVIASGAFDDVAESLQRRGQIRWFGVSCQSPADAIAALALKTVACVEIDLSLLHPGAIASALPAAMRAGKGVIARQCLASGLLTWKSGDPRLRDQPPQRLTDLERCRAAAAALGQPLASVALRFALAVPGPATTLLGAHTSSQLADALAWAETPLGSDEYASLLSAAVLDDPDRR